MASRFALASELIAAFESGAAVIAPNHRVAHFWRLQYANYAVSQGRKAWLTPRIDTLEGWMERAWRGSRRDRGQHERLLNDSQAQLVWERIVLDSHWAGELVSPQSAAAIAYRSWLRLQDWRIGRDALARAVGDGGEAQALLEWSERFERTCVERRWLPAALLPMRILEGSVPAPFKACVSIENQEWTPVELAVLEKWAQSSVVWSKIAVATESKPRVVECETEQQEWQAAAQWVRTQIEAGAGSVAVIVPSLGEHGSALRRIFAEEFVQARRTLLQHGERGSAGAPAFTIAGSESLAEFPIVRAALDLLRLATGKLNTVEVGRLLRSPFVGGARSEESQRALMDAQLRKGTREQFDVTTLEMAAASAECSTLAAMLREVRMLNLGGASFAPSVHAERFVQVWKAFGWPGEEALESDEAQVVSRLQLALGEFGALDDLLTALNAASAVKALTRTLRNTYFAPRSAPAPIVILDARSAVGLHFDAAWIAGMDETRWPPAAEPDAFIPFRLQIEYQMPWATAQLARGAAWRLFDELCKVAPTVCLSWARRDTDAVIGPSPWLADFPQLTIAVDATSYASRMLAMRPVLERFEEPKAPAVSERIVRGGARIFELQSLCPFRAFAELRLAARPLERIGPNVDAAERGTLIHGALADIWGTLKSSAELNRQTSEQLETLVRTAVARHAAKLVAGASLHRLRMVQIESELAAERILELLELDRRRAAFQVVGRPESAELATLGSLTFELRLDRVDEVLEGPAEGARIIVDYKTGMSSNIRSWLKSRPEQPQLPLYAATHADALAAVAFATVNASGVAYEGFAREANLLPDIAPFSDRELPAPYREWTGLIEYWRSTVLRLADEFAQGVTPVDPLQNACRYCHLSTLCRIDEQRGMRPDDDDGAA